MAVVWLILKGIGWILLVLLALLIAALLVPVTAELCYEKGQFSAALRVLAVRVKLDPAIMASPIITTLVDTCSIIIYFGIATRVFNL